MPHTAFGPKNYWRMFKARGFLYPLAYFLQVRWFDISRNVDTHLWVPKKSESQGIPNSDHGVIYMASRTSDIKKSFAIARQILGERFGSFDFIDIGSGKGKVVLLWLELCRKSGLKQKVQGIDYSKDLVEIASANFASMFKKSPDEVFICGDASDLNPTKYTDELILYLFNPFDGVLIRKLIENLQFKRVLVIYTNQQHFNVFIENGFFEVKKLENRWLGPEFDVVFLRNF